MNTNKVREHSSTSSSSRGRVKNLVNLFARIEKSESQPTTPPPGVDLRRSSRFRYSARFSNDDPPPLSRERDRRYSSCRRYGEERRRRTEVASLDVVDHNNNNNNKESSSSESSPSAAASAAKMLNNIGTYRSYITSLHQPQQSPSTPNASPSNHHTPHNQTQVRSSRFVSSTLSVVPKCNAQSPDDDSGSNCKRRRSRKVTTSTTVEKNNNNTDVVCVPSSATESSSSSSSGERSSHVQSLRNVVSSTSSIPECDLDTQVATSQDHTNNDACSDHVASSKPFFKRISNPCVTRKPSFRERSVDFKEVKEVFERRGNPFKCLKRTGSRIMNTLRPGRKGTHYDKVETKKVIRSTQGETLAPVQSEEGDLYVDVNDECVQELENSLSNLESTISSLRERIADLENTIRNDLKVDKIDLITEF